MHSQMTPRRKSLFFHKYSLTQNLSNFKRQFIHTVYQIFHQMQQQSRKTFRRYIILGMYGIHTTKADLQSTVASRVIVVRGLVNPPRLIRFREYRRGFQTPHELSFMPATLGRSGFLTTDTAQTQ